jgi:hypothetical protein
VTTDTTQARAARPTAALVLLILGALFTVYAWCAEAIDNLNTGPEDWGLDFYARYSLPYLATIVGAFLLLRHRIRTGRRVLLVRSDADRLGWTGRFFLVTATVSAINALGFFGGMIAAIATAPSETWIPGVLSLLAAVLHAFIAVITSLIGACLIGADRLIIDRRHEHAEAIAATVLTGQPPVWGSAAPPVYPYAPGGVPYQPSPYAGYGYGSPTAQHHEGQEGFAPTSG